VAELESEEGWNMKMRILGKEEGLKEKIRTIII